LTRIRRISISIAAGAAVLAICASGARAAIVTIGSSLTGAFSSPSTCAPGTSCTFSQYSLPGAMLASPVDGAVVRWRILGAGGGPSYKLQVLAFVRDGGPLEKEYTSVRSSAPMTPIGLGLETFSTALPISAGQSIGLALGVGGRVADRPTPGARSMGSVGTMVDGNPTLLHVGVFNQELGFNADIQPEPTVASLSPQLGPVRGGTAVIVNGTDFEDASEVKFGDRPATSFTVDSETKITAVAPAAGESTSVPVSVTTAAGTAVAPVEYKYDRTQEREEQEKVEEKHCVVPRLRGKRLKAAKGALRSAYCVLGKVRKRRGVTARTGRVVGQAQRPGLILPVASRVNLTLGR
jgi:hypothetical protein